MELGSLVTLTRLLVLGRLDEVLGGDGNDLAEDAELDGAGRNTSNVNVKKDLNKRTINSVSYFVIKTLIDYE